ncbi:hypothetical protein J6V86_03735 [bacterium]|nr:hypothetical protein [bacterium]
MLFDFKNVISSYSLVHSLYLTLTLFQSTYTTSPSSSAVITALVMAIIAFSFQVPTNGASFLNRGTACLC